jgi:hypothetical protein
MARISGFERLPTRVAFSRVRNCPGLFRINENHIKTENVNGAESTMKNFSCFLAQTLQHG